MTCRLKSLYRWAVTSSGLCNVEVERKSRLVSRLPPTLALAETTCWDRHCIWSLWLVPSTSFGTRWTSAIVEKALHVLGLRILIQQFPRCWEISWVLPLPRTRVIRGTLPPTARVSILTCLVSLREATARLGVPSNRAMTRKVSSDTKLSSPLTTCVPTAAKYRLKRKLEIRNVVLSPLV